MDLIQLLVWLIVVGFLVGILFMFPIPPMIRNIITAVIGLIFVIYLLSAVVFGLSGHHVVVH